MYTVGEGSDTTNTTTGEGSDTTNTTTGEGSDTTYTTTGEGSDTTNTTTGEGSDTTNTTTGEGSDTTIPTTGEGSDTTIPTTGEGSDSTIPTTGEGSDITIPTTGEGSDTTTGEGSDTTTGEGSDTTTGEGSDTTTGEGSDTTTGEGSDTTTGEGSDTTTGEGSDTTTGEGFISNSSELGVVKRPQRQIRFKSSYQELPTGLQGPILSSRDEGLSYFIQVDVDDPPASTALTKLPEGTKTYFTPQVPQAVVSLRQEKAHDKDNTTQMEVQARTSFSGVPIANKGAAKSLVKTAARQMTISPQSRDVDTNSLHSVDLSKLVTTPETSTLLTSFPQEPPTTDNPNFLAKGISVSSKYSSYWPADSRAKHKHSSRHRYQVYPIPSPTSRYFVTPLSSISSSPAPQDIQLSKYVSSYSSTASLFPTTQSPSSYLTTWSSGGEPPPVATTLRSVSNFQATPPPSTSRAPATQPQTLSKFSLVTHLPFSSSTGKSTTTPPVILSTTTISVSSKSFSSNSFTTVPSVSSSAMSVSNYSSIKSPTSETYSFVSTPSVPSKNIQFLNRIKNPPLPLTFGLKTSTASTRPSSSAAFTSLSQVTPSPGLSLLTSTIQPKHSSSRPRVRTKVYPSTHVQHPSHSRLSSEKSQTLTATYTKGSRDTTDHPVSVAPKSTTFSSVQTLAKHRSRPGQKSLNAARRQSKARTNTESLPHNSTNILQSFTDSRRHTGYGGGGRHISGPQTSVSGPQTPVSGPQTPVSDGKTRTVGSSDSQYTGSIPGRAGIDYPILQDIPKTGFECSSKPAGGYYADQEANCQVFHVCWEDRRASFLCPLGTVFNQQLLVCDWWHNVDCSATETFIYESSAIWSPTTYPNHL
nr:mucin-5AC-like [Procambarus clarkii]